MSQPRTNILEPITHNNRKTVFRVQSDSRVIYSDMRLVDFGVSAVAGATGQENFAYASGAYALIKNIRLYSGNTLLDQCLEVDRIMGHHMLRGSTMDKFDLDQKLVCNSLNIREVQVDLVNNFYDTGLQPLANKLLARLKLDDVLLLLKSLSYFAGWAGDLRLEIEYNTDPTVVLAADGVQGAMTVNRPSLVFEDEMDEQTTMDLIKEQSGDLSVVWNTFEREYISSLGSGLNAVRVRAFDNKMVNHLLMAVGLANGAPSGDLGHGYSLELGQKVNFIVNGVRLMPLGGMDSAARRAASAADQSVLGLCVPTGCHDSTDLAPEDQNQFSDPLFALFGKVAYSAYELNTVINRLDLEFVLPADYEAQNSAYLWASVMKFLTKDAKGNIVVGYQAQSA
jgi:hypothetical protein